MADVSSHGLMEGSTSRGQWRSVSRKIHKASDRVDDLTPYLSAPWDISLDILEQVASTLGDGRYHQWVRTDSPALIMRGTKDRVTSFERGSLASKLREEIELLTSQTKLILAESTLEAPIRAAAFFHLKFVNIHPLKDGNGRVGRVLLAAQCADKCEMPFLEVIRNLEDFQKNYQQIFKVKKENLRFELLLELVALIVGVAMSKDAACLPFSTTVTYPDLTPLPDPSTISIKKDAHGKLLVGVGVDHALCSHTK